VRLSGDAALGASFNACVALLWAFRDIHVSFASLYIGKNTARELATGGTPFKAYLAKHRDDVLAHQLREFGDAVLAKWPPLDAAALDAELSSVLLPAAANGIPPHLMRRHAEIVSRVGKGAPSLHRKAFPAAAAAWPAQSRSG
jgi:hypothetical protein